jgi:hypothetical protein
VYHITFQTSCTYQKRVRRPVRLTFEISLLILLALLSWVRLLMFPGVRILHKGVMTLRFIRANEHRAIAIGLPYVLEGLLPTTTAQECALAYNNWRLELSSAVYRKSAIRRGQEMTGVSSLETLAALGTMLQAAMNALNAEVNSFKRQHVLGDEDDTQSVVSGSSRHPRDVDVDILACPEEDNIYATSNQREHTDSAADKITG